MAKFWLLSFTMGICSSSGSPEDAAAAAANRKLERDLMKANQAEAAKVKLLLLGEFHKSNTSPPLTPPVSPGGPGGR